MLRSLVGCQTSANLCFNLLKATASSGGSFIVVKDYLFHGGLVFAVVAVFSIIYGLREKFDRFSFDTMILRLVFF